MQKKPHGYAIPLSLCVAGVTLFLGLSVAQLSSGDLNVATHQYYQERARQMAEYGLERCVVEEVGGAALKLESLSGAHPDDSVTVKVFVKGDVGAPVEIPEGFEYWVAEGRCGQGGRTLASARVGAMVRYGHPAGGAGAQIRYFVASAADSDAVSFKVVNHLNQEVEDEVVISSEALDAPPPGSPVIPGLVTPVTLGPVGYFGGSTRIPKGGSDSLVTYTRAEPIKISKDGGPLNLPDFTPPANMGYFTEVTVTEYSGAPLPPGHYGTLRLQGSAKVALNGTYRFDRIELSPGASTELPQLLVEPNRSARVFVNELSQNGRALELRNRTGQARNFRLTVKPVLPASVPPLDFKLVEGGSVAVVAEGHALRLESDESRLLKGSFAAEVVRASYPEGSEPPWFVYDISATTARRAKGSGGIAPTDGPSEPGGDDGESFSGNSGNAGNSGNRDNPGPTVTSEGGPPTGNPQGPQRSQGTEPMILSRQNL